MEVHRQRCQTCQALDLRNILVREPGKPQAVYVRCTRCGELVARYELQSYYHHGKSFQSWLTHEAQPTESARDLSEAFRKVQDSALAGYAHALAQLAQDGKDI